MSEQPTDPNWVLIKRRVARIGVLRLWYPPDEDQWYVTLDNRTYHNVHTIAPDKLKLWKAEMGGVL